MKKIFKQTIAVFIALLLPLQGIGVAPAFSQTPFEGAQAVPSMVSLSPVFAPAVLRGLKVDSQNPFHFNFVLDHGQSKLAGENLKNEGTKLIKYFLASLTLPENDLWVNLSPYEKDRIITNEFGQTEMGRQLLSEDYLLKKLSASLLHPDAETGKRFWDKVRKITVQKLGTIDVAVDTLNRIWIMPDKAVVYQDQGTAFIGETHLKVLLEEDYVALSHQKDSAKSPAPAGDVALSTQIFRDEILPIIEKEVNEGENFSSLRQIYHSLILASWYKRTLKQSLLSQVYVDQKKVAGVESDDKEAKQKIYEQYLETFKKGVYNLIREEEDMTTGEMIPRKYFSGGVTLLVSSAAIETRPLTASSSIPTVGNLTVFDTAAQGFNAPVASSTVEDGQIPTTNDFILVVDDIGSVRAGVIKELASKGFRNFYQAPSAEDAVRLLEGMSAEQRAGIGVVISDFHMGKRTGPEFLVEDVPRLLPKATKVLFTGDPNDVPKEHWSEMQIISKNGQEGGGYQVLTKYILKTISQLAASSGAEVKLKNGKFVSKELYKKVQSILNEIGTFNSASEYLGILTVWAYEIIEKGSIPKRRFEELSLGRRGEVIQGLAKLLRDRGVLSFDGDVEFLNKYGMVVLKNLKMAKDVAEMLRLGIYTTSSVSGQSFYNVQDIQDFTASSAANAQFGAVEIVENLSAEEIANISKKYAGLLGDNDIDGVGVTPVLEFNSEVSKENIAANMKSIFDQYHQMFSLPQISVKPNLEDAEVLVLGPGKSPEEVLSFMEAFPKIKAIHVVDASAVALVLLDKALLDYQKSGKTIPVVYGYITNVMALPEQFKNRIDVLYQNNVMDGWYFTDGQKKQIAAEVERVLKPGGVFISQGIDRNLLQLAGTDQIQYTQMDSFTFAVKNSAVAANSGVVRNVREKISVSDVEITVNFKVSDVQIPQIKRKGQIFSADVSPLKDIINRFIGQELRISLSSPDNAKTISVESLAETEIDRLFLVAWGSKKYVIKVAKSGRNNYLYNEWEILTHLNLTDEPRKDIVKPLLVGQEFWINESDLSRQKTEYIVTNYLEGADLLELIRRQPFALSDVLKLGINLSDAIRYIHSKDVIVRDLKPNNIRILKDGSVALFDFNASVSQDYDWGEDRYQLRWLEASGWTAEDRRVPLEQRQKPDVMSDIFAIGMTLLWSAVPTFYWVDDINQGDASTDQAVVAGMLKDLGEKSPALAAIILKAIGPRETRYKNTNELKEDLLTFKNSFSAASSAASEDDNLGGIDLREESLNLDLRGEAGTFILPIDPAQVQSIHIDGLVPVILNITPLPNIPAFLKFSEGDNSQPTELL